MKALVYLGPKQLAYTDVPTPAAAPGEDCLIEVKAVGICGSDMHAYLGHDERRPAPLILGHEPAGVVVDGPLKGRRVTVNPLKSCGICRYCVQGRDNLCPERAIISMPPREGAFAEYITSPPANLVEIPDYVSFESACLVEPLAVGWHTVRLCAGIVPLAGARCLVIGGGAIGVSSALALKAQGASDITIVESNALRRPALAALGLGEVITPDQIGSADVVIDAVGYEGTRAAACAAALPGGVIGHAGLGSAEGGVDVRKLTLQEITFIGTYTYTPQDFRDTAAALFDGRISTEGWFKTAALGDGAAAFAEILAGDNPMPKTVLVP